MNTKKAFKDALDKMLKTSEFDKLAKFTETKTDAKAILRFKDTLEIYGANNLPVIPLIMEANADILRSALLMMMDGENDA